MNNWKTSLCGVIVMVLPFCKPLVPSEYGFIIDGLITLVGGTGLLLAKDGKSGQIKSAYLNDHRDGRWMIDQLKDDALANQSWRVRDIYYDLINCSVTLPDLLQRAYSDGRLKLLDNRQIAVQNPTNIIIADLTDTLQLNSDGTFTVIGGPRISSQE